MYNGHKAVAVVPGAVDLVADDYSDHEANVAALQHELEQRKQEVKRLKVEQRARQKEQLKAKERAISQQLHVCHSLTCLLSVTCLTSYVLHKKLLPQCFDTVGWASGRAFGL